MWSVLYLVYRGTTRSISDVMDWDCGKELSAKGRSEYFGGRELFYIWIVVVAT